MVLTHSISFLKHGSLWIYRAATIAVLLAGTIFVALVLGLRYYVLPNIDQYKGPIERAAGRAVGQPVSIGSIGGSWQGYRPELHFANVRVFDARGEPALDLGRVEVVVAWVSLLAGELRLQTLEVFGPHLEVRRDPQGVIRVAGMAIGEEKSRGGGVGDWLLAQRQIIVRDAGISWVDDLRNVPELRIEKVDLRLDNSGDSHEFGMSGEPPAEVASAIALRGEFSGRTVRDLRAWSGRLYAGFDRVNLAAAQAWVDTPLLLTSGEGALRLWLELNGPRPTSAIADVRLANVRCRLRDDLPELALASLSGRLGWKDDGQRREVSADSLSLATADGLSLAPMRFRFARSGAQDGTGGSYELEVERLDIAPLVQIAEFLPLDPGLRGHLSKMMPSGMVHQGKFSWSAPFDGLRPFVAQATFSGLALHPDERVPGVKGLSGQVDGNERGGRLSLSMREGELEMPRVFMLPVPIDVLSAEASWTVRDKRYAVTVANAAFTNEHGAGSVRGSYHSEPGGPGNVDLTGSLLRADARHVWRYIPVIAPYTQAWLQRALVAGESRDVRFRLKGPLRNFPFEDGKAGQFEVIAKVTGATVDFASGWPPATGVTGEVAFRGRRMDIKPQSAQVLGIPLTDVQVSIPQLGKNDERLVVKGSAEAPTSRFLEFVAASPIDAHIGRVTAEIKAQGNARLALGLELPLHHPEQSQASGELVVRDNAVELDPRLPRIEGFSARVAFTKGDDRKKGSVTVREGRARLLGNPLEFEAASQQDGGIALKLAGTLEAQRLAELANVPALHRLDGRFGWTGTVGVRNKTATAHFESDLVGLGSRLPEPLAKAAQDSLPLRIEFQDRAGREAQLGIELGRILGAQLLLDGADPDGIRRGAISFGTDAKLPAADGLWVSGKLGALDVDAWRAILDGSGTGKRIELAGASLQVGELDVFRRRFNDLRIEGGQRDGIWQASLAGKGIAGELSWESAGDGRLIARMAKLALPPPATVLEDGAVQSGDRLPALDLKVEDFRFEGKNLGRLTLLADPDAAGWRLRRLDVTNPDGNLRASGLWTFSDVSRTDMSVRLEVHNIGNFLARLAWPADIKGGSGLLEGPVAWVGPPTRLDYRTLSGRLKLEAKDGRFQEIKPGAAKLLGILSLQALPKRLSFDFADVFAKGFTFNKISANVEITSGVAHTEDFVMEGSAARVGMRGSVDLTAETQDLTVRVIPSLSESIAVAGAIVNPAVGVAALIAQKALKDPFNEIAAFEYKVTGKWTEPVVARTARGGDGGGGSRGR